MGIVASHATRQKKASFPPVKLLRNMFGKPLSAFRFILLFPFRRVKEKTPNA
ncbi:hypothetical protein [Victivallis vadensis]|uniref:hypothetical protein n=1 Tax=Victivallis vadensis TaxID=172901 RepID=UPI003AF9D6E0